MSAQHLTLPIRVTASGSLAATEQDSDADLQSCLVAIVSYPPGYRLDDPDFGAAPALFEENGADVQTLVERVTEIDERLDPDAVSDLLNSVQTVTLDLEPGA